MHTTDEVVGALLDAGLPAGPILNVEQVFQNEHFQVARQMFTTVSHPQLGEVNIMNQSFKMSETNPYVRNCAPLLGQDNTDVLMELGYSETDIQDFKEAGVI